VSAEVLLIGGAALFAVAMVAAVGAYLQYSRQVERLPDAVRSEVLSEDVKRLQEAVESLNKNRDELVKEISAFEKEKSRDKIESESLHEEVVGLRNEKRELVEKTGFLKEQLKEVEAARDRTQAAMAGKEDAERQLSGDVDVLLAERQELKTTLSVLRASLDDVENKLAEREQVNADGDREAARRRQLAETELEKVNLQIESQRSKLDDVRAEVRAEFERLKGLR
jgi:chromosome segregation ATPase